MRLPAILALATLSLTALPLAAEDDQHRCRCDGEGRAKLLERFDANKDGTLDEGEKAAAKAAMQAHRGEMAARILAKHPELDTNGDGTLSKEEAEAGRAQHQAERQAQLKEKHPEVFARIDSNGDGSIDDAERKAAKEAFLAKHPEADQNGDGRIGPCERKEFRQERRAEHQDNGRRAHGEPNDNGHDHGRRGADGK